MLNILVGLLFLIGFVYLLHTLATLKAEVQTIRDDIRRAPRRERFYNYQLNKLNGNNAQAIDDLKFLMMFELTHGDTDPKVRRYRYEEFKKINQANFLQLGCEMPEYPFND